MKYFTFLQKDTKGFTVLEFLVILFIMTILLSIVLTSFTRSRRNTQNKISISDFRNVQIALEEYRAQCKVYPKELEGSVNNAYPGSTSSAGYERCILEFGQVLDPETAQKLNDSTLEFRYTPLQNNQNNASPSGAYSAYHLSTQLLLPSGFLNEDSDFGGNGSWSTGSHVEYKDTEGWYDLVVGAT
ncbi:type II secretion system protein [Candidatus Nomurabacteria bacterium]|nr:type II secretion system protein [Candidatus Nomurabacteria bacterium]